MASRVLVVVLMIGALTVMTMAVLVRPNGRFDGSVLTRIRCECLACTSVDRGL